MGGGVACRIMVLEERKEDGLSSERKVLGYYQHCTIRYARRSLSLSIQLHHFLSLNSVGRLCEVSFLSSLGLVAITDIVGCVASKNQASQPRHPDNTSSLIAELFASQFPDPHVLTFSPHQKEHRTTRPFV